jgi:hypothetical protein
MAINIDLSGIEGGAEPVFGPTQSSCPSQKLVCHACGFESQDPFNKWMRCPKCGGASWESFAAPGSLLKDQDDAPDDRCLLPLVRFRVHHSAQQVYIFGDFHGSPRLIPMREKSAGHWAIDLRLAPATYHYRFYVDDGEHLVWFAPHQASSRHCADETLVVTAPEKSDLTTKLRFDFGESHVQKNPGRN